MARPLLQHFETASRPLDGAMLLYACSWGLSYSPYVCHCSREVIKSFYVIERLVFMPNTQTRSFSYQTG